MEISDRRGGAGGLSSVNRLSFSFHSFASMQVHTGCVATFILGDFHDKRRSSSDLNATGKVGWTMSLVELSRAEEGGKMRCSHAIFCPV